MKVELQKDGAVTKDGEVIGTYHAETNTLHCPKRIAPNLYKPIAAALGGKPNYDFGKVNEGTHKEDAHAPKVEKSEKSAKAVAYIEKVLSEKNGEFPGAPPMDPQFGDKTPAFAKFLRDKHPKEFERRYANRKLILED